MSAADSGELPWAPAARVRGLDMLRLVAAFQMVQGHTIDAVLAPEWRSGVLFAGWLWLRGLTSVVFLFAAGAAFNLATLREFERHRADRAAVTRRFRRATLLIVLGYALHVPLALMFVHDAGLARALVHQAFAVDVLQCIGVCLALLEALTLLLPNARAVEISCAVLGTLWLLASPLARQLDPGAWFPLLGYFSARAGSLFPLLPWGAHILLGAAFARVLLAPGKRMRLWAAALLVIAVSHALPAAAAPIPDHLSRLGFVLVALALLGSLERAARVMPARAWALSAETLFIYAFHVLLVYGQGIGVAALVGRRLAPAPSVLLAAAVIALSFAGALGYRRLGAGLARSTATS
jgi:acyltransferase